MISQKNVIRQLEYEHAMRPFYQFLDSQKKERKNRHKNSDVKNNNWFMFFA